MQTDEDLETGYRPAAAGKSGCPQVDRSVVRIGECGRAVFVDRADAFGAIGMDG